MSTDETPTKSSRLIVIGLGALTASAVVLAGVYYYVSSSTGPVSGEYTPPSVSDYLANPEKYKGGGGAPQMVQPNAMGGAQGGGPGGGQGGGPGGGQGGRPGGGAGGSEGGGQAGGQDPETTPSTGESAKGASPLPSQTSKAYAGESKRPGDEGKSSPEQNEEKQSDAPPKGE